jgi:hypothetical protein
LQVFACQAATAIQNARSFEGLPFPEACPEKCEAGQSDDASDDASKPLLGATAGECDLEKGNDKLVASTAASERARADSKASCSSTESTMTGETNRSISAPQEVCCTETSRCEAEDATPPKDGNSRFEMGLSSGVSNIVLEVSNKTDPTHIEAKARNALNAYMLEWLALVDHNDLDRKQLANFLVKIEQAQNKPSLAHGCAFKGMQVNQRAPPFSGDVESPEGVASFCASLVYELLLSMTGRCRSRVWSDKSLAGQEDGTPMSSTNSMSSAMGKKKSGRSRQRAAKYWSSVRCRTPSPSPFLVAEQTSI